MCGLVPQAAGRSTAAGGYRRCCCVAPGPCLRSPGATSWEPEGREAGPQARRPCLWWTQGRTARGLVPILSLPHEHLGLEPVDASAWLGSQQAPLTSCAREPRGQNEAEAAFSRGAPQMRLGRGWSLVCSPSSPSIGGSQALGSRAWTCLAPGVWQGRYFPEPSQWLFSPILPSCCNPDVVWGSNAPRF